MENPSHAARVLRQLSPQLLVGLAAVALVHAFAIPDSFWEFDEPLFAQAIWNYDPWIHHPPPPGYPLFIALGKLLNFFLHDPFVTLVTLSYVATIVGFLAMSRAFSEIAGDSVTGVLSAAIFYLSPTMLIHGTLPQSDALALCVFAFALWAGARSLREPSVLNTIAFGLLAGLNVGVRPQFSIVILPLVAVTLLLVRGWRPRLLIVGAFTLACLAWFVPMVFILGDLDRMYEFQLGQATYYATHDAGISRGGWSAPRIAGRFVARPWGPLPFALLVLFAALAGILRLARRRLRAFAPLAVAAGLYLAFALATMDPADGARYALPSVVAAALAAGAGLMRICEFAVASASPNGGVSQAVRRCATGATIVLAVANITYVSSIIAQRSHELSPPARAADWIREHVPPDAVILVELPLWPHASYWLDEYRIMKLGEAEQQFVRNHAVPLYILADGLSKERDATTFDWETSHAYRKLTRNHYRVVSIVPLGPEDRFQTVRGVHAPERDALESWRWLEPEAEIVLPDVGAARVVLRFGLTRTAPIDGNRVALFANGVPAGEVNVDRGAETDVVIPLNPGENRLLIRSQKSFIPASGGGGDPRRLAVRLMDLDQE